MPSDSREMTLKEYVEVLPKCHTARREYDQLLRERDKLSCLEACGVDNWQGYDDAMAMFNEGEEISE